MKKNGIAPFSGGFLIIYTRNLPERKPHTKTGTSANGSAKKSLIFITDVAVELKHRGQQLQLKIAAFVVIDAIDDRGGDIEVCENESDEGTRTRIGGESNVLTVLVPTLNRLQERFGLEAERLKPEARGTREGEDDKTVWVVSERTREAREAGRIEDANGVGDVAASVVGVLGNGVGATPEESEHSEVI